MPVAAVQRNALAVSVMSLPTPTMTEPSADAPAAPALKPPKVPRSIMPVAAVQR